MPRIPSYPLIGSLSSNDLLVIDDASQQYATKSVELQSLKGYFNTGQATTTYVDDKVVSGAGFNTNTGVLTLTRTDGVNVTQNLDGRYALTSSVFSGNYNDLTNTPTTIAGYGITDALQLGITATTALAGNTTTITQAQADEITANTLKTSFPGFGTTAGKALEGNTVIPAAYTNADVDAHLNTSTAGNNEVLSWTGSNYDWVAQSGGGGGDTYDLNAGTKSGNSVPLNLTSGSGSDNSSVNLTEGSNVQLTQTSTNEITISSTGGTVTGAWQTLNRTFTGSELVNAFNGNNTDKITLVTVGTNEIISLGFCTFICKANTTGTTDYTNTGSTLYVVPENSSNGWGVIIEDNLLESPSQDQVSQNLPSFTRTNTSSRPAGANLVLGNPSNVPGGVNLTQGDRDFIIQITYRITNF